MTKIIGILNLTLDSFSDGGMYYDLESAKKHISEMINQGCLLYTSPSPRDATLSRMPSSA